MAPSSVEQLLDATLAYYGECDWWHTLERWRINNTKHPETDTTQPGARDAKMTTVHISLGMYCTPNW